MKAPENNITCPKCDGKGVHIMGEIEWLYTDLRAETCKFCKGSRWVSQKTMNWLRDEAIKRISEIGEAYEEQKILTFIGFILSETDSPPD